MSRSATSTRTRAKASEIGEAEKLSRLLKSPQPVVKVEAPPVVQAVLTPNPEEPGKPFGGSEYADFNKAIVSQVQAAVWAGNAKGIEELTHLALSAAGGLAGMKPQDAVEGMLAAQMVATHNATMECFRRAMIRDQTMEGRNSSLAHANKLTRSFATLSQALDKHRGQGKQTVRVEHVHVYEGGKAMVGSFNQTEMRQVENATPSQLYAPGDENDRD